MIKKLFILFLSLNLMACGGFNVRSGLRFKNSVETRSYPGNPGFMRDTLTLKNKKNISFHRPMGKCGAGVAFFGIILPVIPVWIFFNSCHKQMTFEVSKKVIDLKLKYGDKIYEAVKKEDLIESPNYVYGARYIFKLDSFFKFRLSRNKALIVTTEDGYTQELPVKWGIMIYNNWSVP